MVSHLCCHPLKVMNKYFDLILISFFTSQESIIKISDEIESALVENRPVVALESTIITHGMPFPVNLQLDLIIYFRSIVLQKLMKTFPFIAFINI